MVSFGMLLFLAISMIDANFEFVAGFGSFSSEKDRFNMINTFSIKEKINLQNL